ncbi:MAG: C-GCAxxG-C-C family protein, partial [Deltaproteobacteria bacterium]|nr:C-GCAxxG-C-C family protein [Deltaproteobacteria bacterium]
MKEAKDATLDTAFDKAKQNELRSGGCAQCTVAGIFEALGVEDEGVFRAATGLADGVGLTGDGHCGALSG